MGWLARRFGLSCDNVASYEVVTADGEIVRASGTEHADLCWGLRGGGGNFGVVTDFEFRLHEVGTASLVVSLFFPAEEAAAALRRWRDLIAGASRQATFTAWVGMSGDWPFLPPAYRNRRLAGVGYVWVGDPDAGRRLLPSLRGAGSPVAERIEEMAYVDLQRMDDDTQGHTERRYWKGHYLHELTDDAIDAFLGPDLAAGPSDRDSHCSPTEARSPTSPTTTRPSPTVTRSSSSSRRHGGPIRRRTPSGSTPRGGTPRRSNRTRAARTSTS